MTQTDFQRALAATLVYEGGWSDNPADPGGATMRGVTQAVFSDYLRDHGRPVRSVRGINDAELQDIYQQRYWLPVTQGRTWPLNAVLFDVAVNSGVSNALWMLEQARPKVAASDPKRMLNLALAVCDVREQFFRNIVRRRPASRIFLNGWLGRVSQQRRLCQTSP